MAKHHDGKTPQRLEHLATKEHVPSTFLVQILSDLKQANLVISKRGKNGGYLLASEPSQISLAEIIEAVDPQLMADPELQEGESAPALLHVWQAAAQTLNKSLKETTLDKLAQSEDGPMWFI